MLSVLILIPLPPVLRDGLAAHYALHEFPRGPGSVDWATLPRGVFAVVTNGTTGLDAPTMDRLPELRVVSAMGVGYEKVDVAAAKARGIMVTHAPGANATTVADHAIGFALGLARGYRPLTNGLAQGEWAKLRGERPTLSGARVGIVGLGLIGSLIARRAAAFGSHIGYHEPAEKAGVDARFYPVLHELARDSDFLIASCPGGPGTRHLFNSALFDALGSDGFVINVSRGTVLNTRDLLTALKAGRIAGAALDVLEEEPAPPPELLRELGAMDNVLLTPHLSGRSPEAFIAQRDVLLRSLEQASAGQRPTSHVPDRS